MSNAYENPSSERMLLVLLVDDHVTYLEFASRFLNRAGGLQVVGSATTAREGVEAARQLRPDLVLLDIGLPDQSGLDVIAELKALDEAPRVIVVSTKDPVYGERAKELGADAFVHKSRMAEELVPAIKKLTGR